MTIPLPASLRIFGREVAFSTAVQLLGKLLQIVLSAVVLKLTAVFLSQSGQGVFSAVTEFALFVSTAANFGFFANVVRRMADHEHDGRLFSGALVLRLTTGVACSLVGLGVLLWRGSDPTVLVGASLFLVALLLDQVTSICDGMLQANYLMGRAMVALIAGRVVMLALTLLVIRSPLAEGSAIPALFAASIAASAVTMALSLGFVARRLRWDWRIDRGLLRGILVTSLPFGVVTLANALSSRFLPDLVAHGVLSDAEFASFSLTFRIAQVVSLLSTFFMYSVLPSLRRALVDGDRARARALVRSATRLLAACGALLVVVGGVAGPALLALLTHQKYVRPEWWFLLPAMLLVAAVSYLTDVVLVVLLALDQDTLLMRYALVSLCAAGVILALAPLLPSPSTRLACIVLGALAGEATLVTLGLRRVRAQLAT